jgi:hypothetical protein
LQEEYNAKGDKTYGMFGIVFEEFKSAFNTQKVRLKKKVCVW